MTGLRILLCDDEPLAVRRLEALLQRIPNVEIVGTSLSGLEAVKLISSTTPDLVLIDIEMPDLDGLDVIEAASSVGNENVPFFAFVTAFTNFAFEAFDRGAIDFLSKPVRLHRLEKTVERARRSRDAREATRRLEALQENLGILAENRTAYRDAHVWVPRRGEVIRVDLDQVDRVAAEGAYVRLYVGSNSYLYRAAMGSIESQMDPTRFIRIHRSHLVRADHVTTIRRTVQGSSELILRDNERLPLGRKFAKEARRRILAQNEEETPNDGQSAVEAVTTYNTVTRITTS